MATSHVVGGGSAALVGAVAVSLVNRFFHSHVSDTDAIVIGAAAVSAGAAVGHEIASVGLAGIFKRIVRGAPKPPAPPAGNVVA